jgi:hypothetical protein
MQLYATMQLMQLYATYVQLCATMQLMQLCATMKLMQLYATQLLQLDLLQLEFNNSFNLTLIHGNLNFFMVDSVTCANALDQYIYIICNIRKIVCF